MKLRDVILATLGTLLTLLLFAGLVFTCVKYSPRLANDAPPTVPAPIPAPVPAPAACVPCPTYIPYRKPHYTAHSVVEREADLADARGDRACSASLIAVRYALMRDGMEDMSVLIDHMGAVLNGPDAGVAP